MLWLKHALLLVALTALVPLLLFIGCVLLALAVPVLVVMYVIGIADMLAERLAR